VQIAGCVYYPCVFVVINIYYTIMSKVINQFFSSTDIIFLCHILGISRSEIILNKPFLTNIEKLKLKNYNKLLSKGYPIDYIIGEVKINENIFHINDNVLIPRPETEEMIEYVKKNTKYNDLLIDIGSGSGLIGVSLSGVFKTIVLTDISQRALNVAKSNIETNNKQNIKTFRADLINNKRLQELINKSSNCVLIANLPYIPEREAKNAKINNIAYEPPIALYSGKDGLDCFRKLTKQLAILQNKPKECYFELDPSNIIEACEIMESLKYHSFVLKDSNNLDRFLISKLRSKG
jgi:release factor glutamine methyltransferase